MKNNYLRWKKVNANWIGFGMLLLALLTAVTLTSTASGYSQNGASAVTRFRTTYLSELGVPQATGLTLSPLEGIFLVVEPNSAANPQSGLFRLHLWSQFDGSVDSVAGAVLIADPINMVFDSDNNRWFLLDSNTGKVIEIGSDFEGRPDPINVKRYNIPGLNIQNAAGVTYDSNNNRLVILDGAGPMLLSMDASGWPDKAGDVLRTDLSGMRLDNLRGVAFDPSTSHFHVFDPVGQQLHELTEAGEIAQSLDMSEVNIGNLQGMVFAPSADSTDDPSRHNLYLIDNQPPTLAEPSPIESYGASATSEQTNETGRLVEANILTATNMLVAPAAAEVSFVSSWVRTTDLSQWSLPSPDPSGLAYLDFSDTLLMSDGEVEEIVNNDTNFAGANLWETTLGGTVIGNANISEVAPTVVPMTNEPTGVAWNPTNGHYYFTDDDKDAVFDLDPGPDQTPFTNDDTWTNFDTRAVGSNDPEGITYDSVCDCLFVVDGVNMEVYQFTRGGSLVNQFDVETLGVIDPEGIELNNYSGTLFILSSEKDQPLIFETTSAATLIQTIGFSGANPRAAAGLAFAPASDGSGALRFYIVDRGIDNNSSNNPNIVDGKMFEMTAPIPLPADNTPPTVDAGADQTISWPNGSINLDGTVTDDDETYPPAMVTSSWSRISGPGTVTFANANAVDTTASFGAPGNYVLRLTANDGELVGMDEVNIFVNLAPVAVDDSVTTYQDRAVNIEVLANDTDADGNSLTVSSGATGPSNGTVTVEVDETITYTPNAGFKGMDTFTYDISDGKNGGDTARVNIRVQEGAIILLPIVMDGSG